MPFVDRMPHLSIIILLNEVMSTMGYAIAPFNLKNRYLK
ncbi:hypothetical protein COO91_05522 [Nostoc flagelliforme CCNUN1]|uniref:Uncharacterized protein n=1 Tax=Nostoc flagelliforme CCNUN1 TaxID=2038116 RepID=A0A2K8SVQ7_9NOSO|nr:hypothetical protein COO91_05522 [Nostoc flagelliforme CCNUN1]